MKRAALIEKILQERGVSYEVMYTNAKGHAIELARSLVEQNAKSIVAVGGDGTASEVGAGFFTSEGKLIQQSEKISRLCVLPAGSGCDLARSLQLPASLEDCLNLVDHGDVRAMDAGIVKSTLANGDQLIRPFINIVDVGMGGEVIELMEKKERGWFPTMDYLISTIQGLIQYENKNLTIEVNEQKIEKKMNLAVVANGQYFGSGMRIAPTADLFDGKFTVVLIDAMSKPYLISKLGTLRKGTHVNSDGVSVLETDKIKIWSSDKALLDLDGELAGQCPMEVEMVAGAIPVFIPRWYNKH